MDSATKNPSLRLGYRLLSLYYIVALLLAQFSNALEQEPLRTATEHTPKRVAIIGWCFSTTYPINANLYQELELADRLMPIICVSTQIPLNAQSTSPSSSDPPTSVAGPPQSTCLVIHHTPSN